MKQAILLKYLLIPYYYTELDYIHIEGGSLFKPLFFEFPTDPVAYEHNHNDIMIGPAIKASILTNSSIEGEYNFYFPTEKTESGQPVTWCNMIIYKDASRCFQGG